MARLVLNLLGYPEIRLDDQNITERLVPYQKAFALLDSGTDINYEGASGTVDFDENGDVVTPIEIWKYDADGKIVTFRVETQIPEE